MRVANHTFHAVSVRQVDGGAEGLDDADGPWFSVDGGCALPWALSKPLRGAKQVQQPARRRRERSNEDEEDEDEDMMDDDAAEGPQAGAYTRPLFSST